MLSLPPADIHAIYAHDLHVIHAKHVEHEKAIHLRHIMAVIEKHAAELQARQQALAPLPAISPTATASPSQMPVLSEGPPPDSSFQACVIARESGGQAQIVNASGHYGLYQFSASTWAAYGGNPADFGHASVTEQNQIFSNAMATPDGASNWSPYDGC